MECVILGTPSKIGEGSIVRCVLWITVNFMNCKMSICYLGETDNTDIVEKTKRISYIPKAVNNRLFQTISSLFILSQLYLLGLQSSSLPVLIPSVFMPHRFEELCQRTQNHRIVVVGRDLWRNARMLFSIPKRVPISNISTPGLLFSHFGRL